VKIVPKALLALAVFAFVVVSVCLCWFYFYSGDLPNLSALENFAPDSPATLTDQCSNTAVQAIPHTLIGMNLQNATLAAEGNNDDTLAVQIARTLFCDSRIKMPRQLLEYKASVQLRRRYTHKKLLTIYLNRAYFGNDLIGVENASLHYYRKHASELDLAQAALIAGLIKAPNIYSPERHPDRAKERRDLVIEGMLRNGTITAKQALTAEQSALR
jgi:membrane carboxypeptidase/penicillin-binding protein